MNEETLKNNVIVPLLQDVGISADELEFESNFTIQLGRGVYSVNGTVTNTISGRSDILCRRNGRPLFLMELKAEGEELTTADKKQGLSYARLLEPMAPYVILTNGTNTLIYETLNGDEVDAIGKDAALNGYQISLESELAIRFEALRHFVGYSYENLLNFCYEHNKRSLVIFRAMPFDPIESQIKKKYVPSAYVPRVIQEEYFEQFLKQETKCVFAIVGESGVGKTNTVCHLVEQTASRPALYYSGSLLGPSFLKDITIDFNLDFSSQESEVSVLKKISTLTQEYGTPFTVFLDAVDEWEAPDKISQLSQIVNAFEALNMRLVVSCKTLVWQSFLSKNGLPTPVADCLFPEVPELVDFDSAETSSAVSKYEDWLGIKMLDDAPTLGPLNPFALRIACEVAHAEGVPLDLSKESRSTLSKYFVLKLEKCKNGDLCLRFLNSVSQLLLDQNQVQVHEDRLRAALALRIYDEIPIDLFAQNILYKYLDDMGRVHIGFYFSLLRDYLIATNVLGLDKLDDAQRVNVISKQFSAYIGESAVIYFFRTGNSSEQSSCVEASIEYDRRNHKAVLARLLAWHGSMMHTQIKTTLRTKILEHFKYMFEENKDDLVIANQIVDSIEAWEDVKKLEPIVANLFATLIRYPTSAFTYVSHRLAYLLSQSDDPSTTKLLVSLLAPTADTSYVRRYIVESLSSRTLPDKKALFLTLAVDESADVRGFVTGWYPALEDEGLRDELLLRFDQLKVSSIRQSLALTLARSSLPETGERLYKRLLTHKFDDELSSWIYRSIAELDYKAAIPHFIKLLRSTPYSDQAGHLLIALGDMDAIEAMPALFEIIQGAPKKATTGTFAYWIAYAFSSLATEEDYRRLESIASSSLNKYAVFLATLLMAESGRRQYDPWISKFVSNKRIPISQRETIFQDWGHGLIGYSKSGVWYAREGTPHASEGVLLSLYSIFNDNNTMSIIALGLLINLENNTTRLCSKIVEVLPQLKGYYSTRELPLINRDRLEALAHKIKPWLNIQIASRSWSKSFINNCMTLVLLVGDTSTLEAINTNRASLELVLGKHVLDQAEHVIRKSQGRVRLTLD